MKMCACVKFSFIYDNHTESTILVSLLFLDFIFSILQFCTIFFFFLFLALSLAVCFKISFPVKLGMSSSYTIFVFFWLLFSIQLYLLIFTIYSFASVLFWIYCFSFFFLIDFYLHILSDVFYHWCRRGAHVLLIMTMMMV